MTESGWTEEMLRWLEDIVEHVAAKKRADAGRVVGAVFERMPRLLGHLRIGYQYAGSGGNVGCCYAAIIGLRIRTTKTNQSAPLEVFHESLDLNCYGLLGCVST
jgi:plasmid stabilization system protein ParE